MKVIVITGSTRGIGYGLAQSFLDADCAVVINGRSQESVDRAVKQLAARYPAQPILGVPADVSNAGQVQALWDAAVGRFGHIDIWINNAGLDNHRVPLWELEPAEMHTVVETNLTSTLYACRVAIRGMIAQGHGQIYNMEGMGSDDRLAPGLTTYSTTKRAITFLTKALVAETADLPIQIGTINPGMVLTDMLLADIPPERAAQTKRIYNILADRVETVAPWLVKRMLANQRSGVHIDWMTTPKIFLRFLLARFRKRDLFGDEVSHVAT